MCEDDLFEHAGDGIIICWAQNYKWLVLLAIAADPRIPRVASDQFMPVPRVSVDASPGPG